MNNILLAGLTAYWLIFLHIAWPNSGGYGTDLPYNLLGWGFMFTLCAAFWLLTPATRVRTGTTGNLLIAGACLMTLPLAWSPSLASVYYALPRLGGMWGGILFWLTLRQCRFSDRQRMWLLYCLAGAGIVEAAIVLTEIYGPRTELPVIWQQLIAAYGRGAVGVFQQVNVTASFLGMALAAMLLLLTQRAAILNERKRECFRLALLALGGIATTAVLTVIYSRTGWLAGVAVVACLVYLFYFSRFRQQGQRQYLLLAVPLCGITLGLLLMPLSVNQALAAHEGSNHQRLLTLYNTFKYASLHPLIGYGAGSYEGFYQRYLAALPGGNPGVEMMFHPHNELLYQFAEGGAVAVAGLLIWAAMLVRLWRRSACVLSYGALICMLPVLLHSQLEYPLYYSVPHYLMLLMLLCVAEPVSQTQEETSSRRSWRYSAIYLSMFVLATYGAALSVQSLRVWRVLDRYEHSALADPEVITHLHVPWVKKLSYDQDITLLRLFRFQHHPDMASLRDFTHENAMWMTVHAWSPLYHNQIAVLKYLKDNKGAAEWELRAQRTFTWDSSFHKPGLPAQVKDRHIPPQR